MKPCVKTCLEEYDIKKKGTKAVYNCVHTVEVLGKSNFWSKATHSKKTTFSANESLENTNKKSRARYLVIDIILKQNWFINP